MTPIDHPSPNFGARLEQPIDLLILHYTGMRSADAALERLCGPASGVSCHWLIDEDGTTYRLVDEAQRAWHAGLSSWAGVTDINSRSIGIELVNPGHEFGHRPFPAAQMESLVDLAAGILRRHLIPKHRILGHSDVAPKRKCDPGELFDWAWLAGQGIGLWPATPSNVPLPDLADTLESIGYADGASPETITAFQRHWRPATCDGQADDETRARAAAVAIAASFKG